MKYIIKKPKKINIINYITKNKDFIKRLAKK